MDIQVLDNNFTPIALIENYFEFLWSERYDDIGDVELELPYTPEAFKLLKNDTFITHTETNRIARLEVDHAKSTDEGRRLVVTGRTIEKITKERVLMKSLAQKNWDMSGSPAALAHRMFEDICVLGTGVSANDALPNVTAHNLVSGGASINIFAEQTDLYTQIRGVLVPADLGWRIVQVGGSNALRFEVYQGVDRTREAAAGNPALAPVMFSPTLDNLSDPSYKESTEEHRNYVYIIGPQGYQNVDLRDPIYPSALSGWDRKVAVVSATDVPGTAANYTQAMWQRGLVELADLRKKPMVDGIADESMYKFRTHYDLGDLVSYYDVHDHNGRARVVEYVWSSNQEGIRRYPTLSVDV